MPIISTSLEITVRMYFADHGPPHVLVAYKGHEALIAIWDGNVIEGSLPSRAGALGKQWCLDNRAELERNWTAAQALQPLQPIRGADND